MEEKKDKIKIGIGAWIALIFFIIILSGVFRTSDTPLKILDLTNLTGTFGLIGDTESNFMVRDRRDELRLHFFAAADLL